MSSRQATGGYDPSGIDPANHALLLGQSHRNRAEIERLQRLYDERGEQLRELTKELKGECDARAEAEAMTVNQLKHELQLMGLAHLYAGKRGVRKANLVDMYVNKG